LPSKTQEKTNKIFTFKKTLNFYNVLGYTLKHFLIIILNTLQEFDFYFPRISKIFTDDAVDLILRIQLISPVGILVKAICGTL